ncbi:MAG: hypothetical protein IJH04_11580, partial [Eggerthellaceae bacterium]|nr:hypothetical protein [Eggerthellaceae bacterium]
GVQSHTLTLWKLLQKYHIPCFIFVNKMDMDGADKALVFRQLKAKLSENCVEFTAEREELYENIALCDDILLEKYSETDLVEEKDIVR